MDITTENEVIRQNYDYIFLSDILEMIRGRCGIIHSDKKLYQLFISVVDYVNSCLPPIEGEVIDFDMFVTVKK